MNALTRSHCTVSSCTLDPVSTYPEDKGYYSKIRAADDFCRARPRQWPRNSVEMSTQVREALICGPGQPAKHS